MTLAADNSTTQNQSSRCAFRTAAFHSKFVSIKLYNSEKTTVLNKKNSSWLQIKSGHEVRLRDANAQRRSADEVWSPAQLFSRHNLTFICGIYPCRRNKRRSPTNKKSGREQNPCHECHLCRYSVFNALFLSLLLSQALAVSLSLFLSRTLSLSVCISPSLALSQ